jgi:hypothetical protein
MKNLYQYLIPQETRSSIYKYRKQILSLGKKLHANLDFYYCRRSERIKGLEGEHRGQRCFLMGNGPSLNSMDLSLLKNESVWGSNRCYLLFDRIDWRPSFFVAVDKRVVPDNADEIIQLSRQLQSTKFFFPANFRFTRILKSAPNVYWYNEKPLSEGNLPYTMFSMNLAEYVYSVRTVTVAMLQIAVYLGFNPIYLIGCDTNYVVPTSVEYENGNPDSLISTEADLNHFDSSYFGKAKKWHEPHVDRMIFNYQQAKRVCDEFGVKVFNATVGGNLEVFPRVNYKDLFE